MGPQSGSDLPTTYNATVQHVPLPTFHRCAVTVRDSWLRRPYSGMRWYDGWLHSPISPSCVCWEQHSTTRSTLLAQKALDRDCRTINRLRAVQGTASTRFFRGFTVHTDLVYVIQEVDCPCANGVHWCSCSSSSPSNLQEFLYSVSLGRQRRRATLWLFMFFSVFYVDMDSDSCMLGCIFAPRW